MAGILHRDLSPNNIMFVRPEAGVGDRHGMLIDWDLSKNLNDSPNGSGKARQHIRTVSKSVSMDS